MSKITELKKKIKEVEEKHYAEISAMKHELHNLILERRKTCKHPKSKIRIRAESYFEEGRMSGAHYYRVKYCSLCGQDLAHTYNEEKWTDGSDD